MNLNRKNGSASFPQTAVILAAGRGTRLEEMTDYIPKCLIQVGGQRLLDRMLTELENTGIQEVILVVGYQSEKIISLIGNTFGKMKITYVINSDWETTNNVLSLYMAVDQIKTSFFLLESDIILENGALATLDVSNTMAVEKYKEFMDGTVVTLNDSITVKKMYLKSTPNRPTDLSEIYKTVNIYSFNLADFQEAIVPALKELLDEGRLGVYYELAFARAIDRGLINFKAIDFGRIKWAEIDDQKDWKRAQQMFSESASVKSG
ncbi:MAG: phosphocholine cytidylyltransferase family protein [Saprospirales bacterium]|nr:MAG: phosphocholine cytidylyltransferase family protein [Saprospirales bacterium]